MVVFTCYHCGDSIQKPKVEKHITIECKKKFLNPRLCCIDCLKDFDRRTFVEHTKCFTEEERYSGKGYVPKASSNKNERKQQSWVEIIQAVLKKPKLSELQRKLVQALSNYSNVPRKEQKFKNFVSSSLKHVKVHNSTVDEVFRLIDDEFKAVLDSTNSVPKPGQKTNSADSQQSDKSEVEKSDVQPIDKPAEGKKKKDKLKDIENTSIPEEASSETLNLDETTAKEAKKNKKSKKENVENHNITIPEETSSKNADLDESVAFEVVKKKKKSKRKDNVETEIINESEKKDTVETETVEKPKKKDKVEKQIVNEKIVTVENAEPSNDNSKKIFDDNMDQDIPMKGISKKKLKKLKLQEVQENSPDDSLVNITNGSTEPESNEAASKVALAQENECREKVQLMSLENLSKKERKELKKKLKYEAELKSVEMDVAQPDELVAEDEETQTDKSQKRDKKKKRKLSENVENEEMLNKKKKLIEGKPNEEKDVQSNTSKFSWKEVIRTILENAEGNEISMKKLTKKAVAEYQCCHEEEISYEEILKKFNKKVNKLPFAKILKDKVKLAV